MKLNYGWLFDIRTSDELFEYLQNVRAPKARAEFAEAMKYYNGQAHANHIALLAEVKGISITEAQLKLNADLADSMEKTLRDTGQIFVNIHGGYFGTHGGIRVWESQDIDVFALPEEKVRFIQWVGGTHWYAKIGDEDIVVDGRQKWDTKGEAEDAAAKYLKGKKRK